MNKRLIEVDGKDQSINLPEGWIIDIVPLGYRVWAHSLDLQYGVSEDASTQSDAFRMVKERMKVLVKQDEE